MAERKREGSRESSRGEREREKMGRKGTWASNGNKTETHVNSV